MKKRVFIALLSAFAMALSASAQEPKMTYADAKAQAAKLSKPILIEFYAEW